MYITTAADYSRDFIPTGPNNEQNLSESVAVRLERRFIDAAMQIMRHNVDTISIEQTCRFCNQPTHRGMTSNGEPYYGCQYCKTVFLIKPMALNDILPATGRIRAMLELMAVEGLSYEVAAHIVDEVGIPQNIVARRQIHESSVLYTPPSD